MADIRRVWNEQDVPVIIRRTSKGEKHRLRMPYSESNRGWLRNDRRGRPVWVKKCRHWEIPKAWFNDFVERGLKRFGKVWIIQPYREAEICAAACLNAQGHECQCSCMGANHGMGNNGSWFEVSDSFAVRWYEEEWAARLLIAK